MRVVGLTGSIGMGKSETARMFMDAGIPVFDADQIVRGLQEKNGPALPLIEAAFPGSVDKGVLDRGKLGSLVFANPAAKKKLEAIMHPMVGEARASFFEKAAASGAPFVVLDVPLLFETGGNAACDRVIVVSAPADVQRSRVLARPGMTEEKFEHILGLQMPDVEKKARADYIIDTGHGLDHARGQVAEIIQEMKEVSERA
ncbi:dephospho-CoA kinase [Kordiimonas pumila]|uniref:Dephospho-CoA kinase n=1 Tax=Kordiimonas pumila TaxID=2161677 RepID=A0ABV7D9U4_9PROT|nr:dephospho-CoA kinase [Kordiimonas pumila]